MWRNMGKNLAERSRPERGRTRVGLAAPGWRKPAGGPAADKSARKCLAGQAAPRQGGFTLKGGEGF